MENYKYIINIYYLSFSAPPSKSYKHSTKLTVFNNPIFINSLKNLSRVYPNIGVGSYAINYN